MSGFSAAVIRISLDGGTPIVGGWCDTCLTPGVVLVPVNCILADGVATVGTCSRCTTCNPWECS